MQATSRALPGVIHMNFKDTNSASPQVFVEAAVAKTILVAPLFQINTVVTVILTTPGTLVIVV